MDYYFSLCRWMSRSETWGKKKERKCTFSKEKGCCFMRVQICFTKDRWGGGDTGVGCICVQNWDWKVKKTLSWEGCLLYFYGPVSNSNNTDLQIKEKSFRVTERGGSISYTFTSQLSNSNTGCFIICFCWSSHSSPLISLNFLLNYVP
jgi:hypothetical protein